LENHDNSQVLKISFDFKEPWRRKLFSTVEKPLNLILALNEINNVYRRTQINTETIQFTDKCLQALETSYDVSESDLQRIPAEGPLVVVANHPFGGIEGIILASLLQRVRPDVKLMANYLLKHIPEMRDLLIFVDPFGTGAATRFNYKPLKESMSWLKQGHVLGIFPAGEVSHLHMNTRQITDPAWSHVAAKLIQKTQATVLPVFFKGANGPLFQTLGMVHPRLRTLMLPREVLKKKAKVIQVKIGNPISFKKLSRFETEEELTGYLRLRSYVLRNRDKKNSRKKSFSLKTLKKRKLEPLAPAIPSEIIEREIADLGSANLLTETSEFRVFQARAHEIPETLKEIGRLRELTFREAEEGSGKPRDLDHFDSYYTHLFVWDFKNREIVGAYRIVEVDMILKNHGIKGLYTGTLFKYNREFFDAVTPSLELGRSFIQPAYQRNYSSLLLLWKGIGQVVARTPRIRYLFGPVSVNDAYQQISRELMVACLTSREYLSDLSRLVTPRRPPAKMKSREFDSPLARTVIRELEEVSSLIADVESDQKSLPVLLKQYLKLGGKLLCFNIDPAFSYVMDGLILVDLTQTEPKILERYMGKSEAVMFRERRKAMAANGSAFGAGQRLPSLS